MHTKLINNEIDINKKNYYKITKKNFFILIFITILTWLIFFNVSNNSNKKYSFNSIIGNLKNNLLETFYNQTEPHNETKSFLVEKNDAEKCNPIFEKDAQYYANIDDVRYPQSVQLFLNKSINFDCLNKSENIKKILFWNPFFDDESYSYGLGVRKPFINQNCPVTSCELLTNKSRINESDFVLVHMRDPIKEPPQYRPPYQRWIFVLYESPYHAADFTKYNGFFNLTSTYTIDSDFPGFYENYADLIWSYNKEFNENYDFYKGKSEFAVAVISNCGAPSQRLEYIKQLQNHIPVSILGKCGVNCPNNFKNGTPGNCKEIVAAEYKFYLSFENSVCKDYITEKLFQILKYNIIPVVLGGGLYSHYVIIFFIN